MRARTWSSVQPRSLMLNCIYWEKIRKPKDMDLRVLKNMNPCMTAHDTVKIGSPWSTLLSGPGYWNGGDPVHHAKALEWGTNNVEKQPYILVIPRSPSLERPHGDCEARGESGQSCIAQSSRGHEWILHVISEIGIWLYHQGTKYVKGCYVGQTNTS